MGFDQKLFFKINGLAGKNKKLDILGFFAGRWLIYLIVSFFIVVSYISVYGLSVEKTALAQSLLAAMLWFGFSWLVGWIVNMIIGFIVRRPRPYITHKKKVNLLFTPLFSRWKSMPSDHAMTSALVLMLSLIFLPIYILPLMAVLCATVVCGRIFCGVHYPSDVLVGALVGMMSPIIIMTIISLVFFIQII